MKPIKHSLIFLSILTALLLTGCGNAVNTYTDNTSSNQQNLSENNSHQGTTVPAEDIPRHEDGRAIVTLSSFHVSPEIEAAVVAFNKSNAEYYVEILTADEGTSAGDYWEREMIEISAGKGPDLFSKTTLATFHTYVQKGVMEDLMPYIERDLNVEDYVESSLFAYARDGKVYALESDFIISLYVGSKDILGAKESWTFAEMEQIMAKNPQLTTFRDTHGNVGSLLKDYLGFGSPSYTDYDTLKKCIAFDKAYSKNLPSDTHALPGKTVLVEQINISNALDLVDYETLYETALTPVGYVNEKGNGILHSSFGWSINSASKQKEGAWAFLRYLLSEEYQRAYVTDFSPMKEILEEQLIYYGQPISYTYYDKEAGEEYTFTTGHRLNRTSDATQITPAYVAEHGTASIEIDCMTTEQLDTIRRLIDNSRTSCFDWDTTAHNIIFEEAEYYFNEERSLEEVMRNIENRMELYMAETQ
ncbi:MAG: extracellular solute-binding protein [Lachnospiraceae bacterium]|nr:extracellular solute-binding protein [Lachnospiraceae bacterium]MBQ7777173.1 extracellular solute-binding protein [Lachnospiraceae bacterium]